MMEQLQQKPLIVAGIAAVAVLAVALTVWQTTKKPSGAFNQTKMGPINPMSSMMGPGAGGAPQTAPMGRPPGVASGQPGQPQSAPR